MNLTILYHEQLIPDRLKKILIDLDYYCLFQQVPHNFLRIVQSNEGLLIQYFIVLKY